MPPGGRVPPNGLDGAPRDGPRPPRCHPRRPAGRKAERRETASSLFPGRAAAYEVEQCVEAAFAGAGIHLVRLGGALSVDLLHVLAGLADRRDGGTEIVAVAH